MIAYQRVKLSDLHQDPANARLHPDENLADIRASLKEFGQVEPLVVQKSSSKIVGGNGRYKVMQELGWTECDVAFVEMDNMKATALGIALNRAGERAEWDTDVLNKLLAEIGDDVSEELAASLKELEDEIAVDGPPGDADAEPQIDKAAELQKKWGTETGQLWLLGEHRLLCGDSTKREDVERVMGGEKADMVFTDPPYGVNYEGGRNPDSNTPREKLAGDATGDVYLTFIPTILQFCKPSTPLYIWFASTVGKPVYDSVHANGYKVRALIVWHKLKAHYGNFMAQYMQKHEPCLYCVKEAPPWHGPTNEVTVWEYDQPTTNEHHPTQKPIELAARAITNSSQSGDVVCDWFLGSGSTMVAAQNLNRKCYGIEISPAYIAVILERMATAFPALEIRRG